MQWFPLPLQLAYKARQVVKSTIYERAQHPLMNHILATDNVRPSPE